jgi:SP family sugar:H+ symporter-like MFS transporter
MALYVSVYHTPLAIYLILCQIFAGCNMAGAIIVFFFLYESSNLSLESVNDMYNDPHTKAWTSGRWAPEGYNDRKDLVEQTKAAEAQKPLEGAKEQRIESVGNSQTQRGRPSGAYSEQTAVDNA